MTQKKPVTTPGLVTAHDLALDDLAGVLLVGLVGFDLRGRVERDAIDARRVREGTKDVGAARSGSRLVGLR